MPGSEAGLTRRQVLVAGAAAAGYAVAAGPVSAEAIRTPDAGLDTGTWDVPVSGGSLRAFWAGPEGTTGAPVVLVVHEIFGVHEYVRDVCRRLALEGYLAVAPDLYQRQGDPAQLESVDAILEQVVSRVSDVEVLADLDATLETARQNGGHPRLMGATGFCWGGRIVWLYAAHRPSMTAGVAWYGRLQGAPREQTPRHPIDLETGRIAPVLGLYGGADRGIPLESVFAMRQKLTADGIDPQRRSEIMIFPEAPHGFHADYRASHRPREAREAWGRMLDWFRRHGLEPEEREADAESSASQGAE